MIDGLHTVEGFSEQFLHSYQALLLCILAIFVWFFFPLCNQFIFQARSKYASMLSCLFWCQFFIVFGSQGFFYKMNLLFINLLSSFSLYIPRSILHDDTTFMSSEFQTGLIHVVLTSPKIKAPVA